MRGRTFMQTMRTTSFPLVVLQWIIIGVLLMACFGTRIDIQWDFNYKFNQWTGPPPSAPSVVYL